MPVQGEISHPTAWWWSRRWVPSPSLRSKSATTRWSSPMRRPMRACSMPAGCDPRSTAPRSGRRL